MAGSELDTAELRRWMREYTPRLMAVVAAYASGPVEAEDLLQEVWLRAHAAAPTRAAGAPVLGWLIVIALNVGRDYQRRLRRRTRLARLWAWATGPGHVQPDRSGEAHPRSRVWQAVARLPELQRAVVMLRLVDGLSTTETAAALQRAEGTVKASLARAVERLRRELADDVDLPARLGAKEISTPMTPEATGLQEPA
ncbi:MAG TPA: RNA polymerase sigma factor [Gemmatimonadales bacterium]|nr:RNA polymerase sigma factor [Gemmatimonadales bacterium]